eukprot:1262643-Alexandrium_andersonii.AAC.1
MAVLTGCKAKSTEGLRMRCSCATCPWRQEGPHDGQSQDPDRDIDRDEKEINAAEFDAIEEEEEVTDEGLLALDPQPVGDSDESVVRNLF